MYVYYVVMSLCALAFVSLLKPGQALASLRGLADMIVNFKEIWQKRVKIQYVDVSVTKNYFYENY